GCRRSVDADRAHHESALVERDTLYRIQRDGRSFSLCNTSASTKSFGLPDAILLRVMAALPMNRTLTGPRWPSMASAEASSKDTPEIEVRMSMRRGGRPS